MKKLSRTQLKRIMGGNPPAAGCTAKCYGADPITLDCGENSTCKATDNVGAQCNDDAPTCCYSGVPCPLS